MPQHRKDHVRLALVAAAAEVFAEHGVARATIAQIATRAGISTGNLYRYFTGKDELLAEVLPSTFPGQLKRMLKARVEAAGGARGADRLPRRYQQLSIETLAFAIMHRARVAILLDGAAGTSHAGFAAELATGLERWALTYARRAWPGLRVKPALRFALAQIYRGYVAALGRALATFTDPIELRDAIDHLSRYHLAGLDPLFAGAARRSA